ncbi:hypothetical protein FHL15_002710 [Xylaria flabelliformis]|uniref:Mid2 domain-containing protein n=1 Tax=Xylaria flabelliformis TaxID=2512241 RepID=A0A553I8B2_9PEZI|nr:hypothetical protein FHL15_002710 [Xylaria flabelliformis]
MRILALFFFSLPSLIQGKDASFISPTYQHSTGTGKYGGDSQWPLGSTQIVAFSTTWDEYRLEFWQQDLTGGAKKSLNFNYTQTAGQKTPQSFQWTVQTYELQLSSSPVFFFWLYNNDNSSLQQSSAYFNITIDSTSSASASSSGLTSLPTSSVSTGSTATSSVLSSASISSTPISSPSGTPDTSKGLSAGAAAGVGVGAALGGILLGVAGLLYWKRNRSRRQRRSELPDSQPMGYSIGSPEIVIPINQHNPKPAEALSRGDLSPVELG